MRLSGKWREWALGAAFLLCMVFLYIMHLLTGFYASPERIMQAHVFNLTGCIAGALLLPFILPLGLLRSGVEPPGFSQRLAFAGFLFLPNIVLLFLGLDSWLSSPVNAAARGISNGLIMALIHGLFISLAGKNRNLWAGFSLCLSLFIFYLVLSLQGRVSGGLIATVLFYGSGLLMVIAGVLVLLYLSAFAGRGNTEEQAASPEKTPAKKSNLGFLFPLFAAAVIFWTNSFTERFFMPVYHLPQGFHATNLAMMLALPVAGCLADRYRQRFYNFFILISFGVFLLAPSLLQFSHSETIFLVLYTLNATSIQLIVVIFPFAVLDLYWNRAISNEERKEKKDGRGGGIGGIFWRFRCTCSACLRGRR
jgi:hypothetical protein